MLFLSITWCLTRSRTTSSRRIQHFLYSHSIQDLLGTGQIYDRWGGLNHQWSCIRVSKFSFNLFSEGNENVNKNENFRLNWNFFAKIFDLSFKIVFPGGLMMSHKKFGPNWFSRSDDYWIQTDKQSIYLDEEWGRLFN